MKMDLLFVMARKDAQKEDQSTMSTQRNGCSNRGSTRHKGVISNQPCRNGFHSSLEDRLQAALDNRRRISTIRSLDAPEEEEEEEDVQVSLEHQQYQHGEGGGNGGRKEMPRQISATKPKSKPRIDFSSNDYLGLAHSKTQLNKVHQTYEHYVENHKPPYLGSTGSRLLSGNSKLVSNLEEKLAKIHSSSTLSSSTTSALLFNSGYDANLSILSSIPMENDYIIIDELVHNSLIMGIKMGRIPSKQVIKFEHNNIIDLKKKLSLLSVIMHQRNDVHESEYEKGDENEEGDEGHQQQGQRGEIIIVVESVYSMDGDIAPLRDILDSALKHGAKVVVDEAHGLGVYGKTNAVDLSLSGPSRADSDNYRVEGKGDVTAPVGGTGVLAALDLESHAALLASVYTFGKAAGCHGAVVIAQEVVVQYLINYARPFVYSTALPPHSLCTIQCAYDTMIGKDGEILRKKVFGLVKLFRTSLLNEFKKRMCYQNNMGDHDADNILMKSYSPIQAIICRGNEHCIRVAQLLRKLGPFDVFPIRSPTVPKGEERIRIILHAHNSEDEVLRLVQCLCWSMNESFNMNSRVPSSLSPKL